MKPDTHMEEPDRSFPAPSGARRRAAERPGKARRSVVLADRIADRAITVGGVFVIIAVFGILIFLIEEILPLFKGGAITGVSEYDTGITFESPPVLNIDEYQSIVVALSPDGTLETFHARTGRRLHAPAFDFQGKKPSAMGHTFDREVLAFGFEDGTVRFAGMVLKTEILTPDRLPPGLDVLDDRDLTDGAAVYSAVPGNQFRRVSVELGLEEELRVSTPGIPVVAVDCSAGGMAERPTRALVTVNSAGEVHLSVTESRLNLLTRKAVTKTDTTVLPPIPRGTEIRHVLLPSKADHVYLADRSGTVYRYNIQRFETPFLAETRRLLPSGVQLNSMGFLLGEQSLVAGGSDGSVGIYFRLDRRDATTADGFTLVRTREFEPHEAPVSSLEPALRGKTFLTADQSGRILLRHGTSEATLLRMNGGFEKTRALVIAPRLDGVLALAGDGHATLWNIAVPHPETSFRTLFGKVWYEGYPEPGYTWQSSAATDEFEPKLSLVPLIFGTVKATFYSLIFAIPIALLGAIYTSEFLDRRIRGTVKPVMEMMASLPSVVLGFVAALVLAPVVETWIAAVILAFLVLPACLVVASYLWQFLPERLSLRLQHWPKSVLILCTAVFGLFLAWRSGPLFEDVFFQGSFVLWVNRSHGGAAPFLFLVFLPVSFLAVSAAASRMYGRRLKLFMRGTGSFQAAGLSALNQLGVVTVSILVSGILALLCDRLGLDARGSFVDTYVQRNTLVVGFAMGFAVIPIIYTLAEDALSSVPEHLRAASFGCGATPWQTGLWIVLPTALSGVFSAIMIGMGRAVGETMIVVMATGNTPIMDWNVFNGLRALSANIAVELPESVKDGTLYRVLFLAGLVLFAMTFCINTLAEIIRQRFRRRAMQL